MLVLQIFYKFLKELLTTTEQNTTIDLCRVFLLHHSRNFIYYQYASALFIYFAADIARFGATNFKARPASSVIDGQCQIKAASSVVPPDGP
jgi:hypothetical protein